MRWSSEPVAALFLDAAAPSVAPLPRLSAPPVLGRPMAVSAPARVPVPTVEAPDREFASRRAADDLVVASRHRRRRRLPRLGVLSVVLAVVVVGVAAVRDTLLGPRWSPELAKITEEIEAARGLRFRDAVPVSEVSAATFARRAAESAWGGDTAEVERSAAEWRALGLLDGSLDLAAIAAPSLADTPAFYDLRTGTVLVVDSTLPATRRFALTRALTVALVEQHTGWAERLAGASPALVTGTRLLAEADALATALATTSPDERAAVAAEHLERGAVDPSPSPYLTALLGRVGVPLWPTFDMLDATARTAVLAAAPFPDGDVIDLERWAARLDAAAGGEEVRPVDDLPSFAGARGATFWYHVLAARIDDGLAWRAARAWIIDDVSTVVADGTTCVRAVFDAGAAAGPDVRAAFTTWAAASGELAEVTVGERPVDSGIAGVRVRVQACDPGPDRATNDGASRLSFGGSPLWAEQLRRLVLARPDLTLGRAACLTGDLGVLSLRDERGVIDGPDGWAAVDGRDTVGATTCPG